MVQDAQRSVDSTERYNFPIRGCMLFGVPNQGTDVANTASKVLTLLSAVFNINRNVVDDLENKSQKLANIASEFRQVRQAHSIPIISFYERQKYSSALGLVSVPISRQTPPPSCNAGRAGLRLSVSAKFLSFQNFYA